MEINKEQLKNWGVHIPNLVFRIRIAVRRRFAIARFLTCHCFSIGVTY